MKYLLFLALPLMLVDQLTKLLICRHLGYGVEVPVIPGFFGLVHVTNTGAAFGVFQGNNAFFMVLAVVALAIVLWVFWRDRTAAPGSRLAAVTKVALALLVAGIVGNLLDRIWRGQVTDYLHFYYRQYEYPSFNVADSCICIAAALLILGSFRTSEKDARKSLRKPAPADPADPAEITKAPDKQPDAGK